MSLRFPQSTIDERLSSGFNQSVQDSRRTTSCSSRNSRCSSRRYHAAYDGGHRAWGHAIPSPGSCNLLSLGTLQPDPDFQDSAGRLGGPLGLDHVRAEVTRRRLGLQQVLQRERALRRRKARSSRCDASGGTGRQHQISSLSLARRPPQPVFMLCDPHSVWPADESHARASLGTLQRDHCLQARYTTEIAMVFDYNRRREGLCGESHCANYRGCTNMVRRRAATFKQSRRRGCVRQNIWEVDVYLSELPHITAFVRNC